MRLPEHLVLVTAFALMPAIAHGQYKSVHVIGSQPGKGTAVSRGSDCFVITAAHVVANPEATVIGEYRKKSKATPVIRDEAADVAVLRVNDGSQICGPDYYMRFDLTSLLSTYNEGVLRVRDDDGTEFEMHLAIDPASTGDLTLPQGLRRPGSLTHFTVRSLSPGESLAEGHSGAMFFIGNQPAGILTSVLTVGRAGGRILRIDRVSRSVDAIVPLEAPLEERARLDPQLAADMLAKNANFIRTSDFCRNLWTLGKWVAKADYQLTSEAHRRSAGGGDEWAIPSLLISAINTVVTREAREKSLYRTANTTIGFVPESTDLNRVWQPIEAAIDACLQSKMNKEVQQVQLRQGLRRDRSDKRTMWIVERTGRAGFATEQSDIWLKYESRAIVLDVWTIQR